jgi:hypothetical protein
MFPLNVLGGMCGENSCNVFLPVLVALGRFNIRDVLQEGSDDDVGLRGMWGFFKGCAEVTSVQSTSVVQLEMK